MRWLDCIKINAWQVVLVSSHWFLLWYLVMCWLMCHSDITLMIDALVWFIALLFIVMFSFWCINASNGLFSIALLHLCVSLIAFYYSLLRCLVMRWLTRQSEITLVIDALVWFISFLFILVFSIWCSDTSSWHFTIVLTCKDIPKKSSQSACLL